MPWIPHRGADSKGKSKPSEKNRSELDPWKFLNGDTMIEVDGDPSWI